MSVAVIGVSHASEPFLTCGVPNLQLYFSAVHSQHFILQ